MCPRTHRYPKEVRVDAECKVLTFSILFQYS